MFLAYFSYKLDPEGIFADWASQGQNTVVVLYDLFYEKTAERLKYNPVCSNLSDK